MEMDCLPFPGRSPYASCVKGFPCNGCPYKFFLSLFTLHPSGTFPWQSLPFCLPSCICSVCCVRLLCGVGGPQGNQLEAIWASVIPAPPWSSFETTVAGSTSTGSSHRLAVITVQQGWQWCSRSPKFPANHLSSTSLLSHTFARFPQHTQFETSLGFEPVSAS